MKSYLVSNEKQNCCGCRACEQICPKQCIKMTADEKGFIYPVTDKDLCIKCGLCEKVCPYTRENSFSLDEKPSCHAMIHKDDDLLMKSASGGAFTSIIDTFCTENFIVFGVEFDDSITAVHSYSDSKSGAEKYRRSKYVQSDTKTAFSDAKRFLSEGKSVLFSGTPCQINAFKRFLQKDYDNLLCVDIVCHGVASPRVFSDWCRYIEKKESKKITDYNMRYKRKAPDGYSIANTRVELSDGRSIINGYTFGYSQLFFKNLGYRDCCYSCDYYAQRASDITIGDCWGIENFAPKLYDGRGVSLLLLNSEKGKKIFAQLSSRSDLITQEVAFEDCKKDNPNLYRATYLKPENSQFWDLYFKQGIRRAIRKLAEPKFTIRLKTKISDMIPKSIKASIKKTFLRGNHK